MSLEPRTETTSSQSDTLFQASLTDQKLKEVEQTLRDMSGILESACMSVAESRTENIASTKRHTELGSAYNDERRGRFECAQAYANLFSQHQTALNDLKVMDNERQILCQELKTQQEAEYHESEVRRDQSDSADNTFATENKSCGTDWDMLEHEITKTRLEGRVQELESERSEMVERHQTELANAADHIQHVTQRIREFENLHDTTQGQFQSSASGQDASESGSKVSLAKQAGQSNRNRKRRQATKPKNVKQDT